MVIGLRCKKLSADHWTVDVNRAAVFPQERAVPDLTGMFNLQPGNQLIRLGLQRRICTYEGLKILCQFECLAYTGLLKGDMGWLDARIEPFCDIGRLGYGNAD
jgi:hypothetical protein